MINIFAATGVEPGAAKEVVPSTTMQVSGKTDSYYEFYGSSWVLDMMKAWDVSKAKQGLTNGILQFNGLTSPTRSETIQHGNGGHSALMGLDVGFKQTYISESYEVSKYDTKLTIPPLLVNEKIWNLKRAGELADLLSQDRFSKVAFNDRAGAMRNFLSVYAVTINDGVAGNGTWKIYQLKMARQCVRRYLAVGCRITSK